MVRYLVVKCPKCGWVQVTTATRYFTCQRCGYKRRIYRVAIIYSTQNPEEARRVRGRKMAENWSGMRKG